LNNPIIKALPEKPKKKESLIGEELEGHLEVLYVDMDTDSSFSLNTTASAILELANGKRTCQDIVDIICETVGGEPQQVYRDTESVLEEFLAHELIS